MVHRARAPDVVLQLVAEFGVELGIFARALVRLAQLFQRVRESLGDEHAAVRAEVPSRIGQVIHSHS